MPIIPKNDPNEAYELAVSDQPPAWWTVTCNGIPVHHFEPHSRDLAERYQRDPEDRLSLVRRFLHDKRADS